MKYTGKLGLSLFEKTDRVSYKPINENTEKISGELDAFGAAFVSEVGARVMMASGKYTGTGGTSVSITTPGFTPKVLLIKQRSGSIGTSNLSTQDIFASSGGWVMWIGENIPGYGYAKQIYPDGSQRDSTMQYTVVFTPQKGGLSWQLTWTHDSTKEYTVPPSLANNSQLRVYEWVAFGTEDVEEWGADHGEA